MVQMLSQGARKAKKRHQCYHCGRDIAPGETYGFQTNKYDYVYTIAWHLDCEELAAKCRLLSEHTYDDEGWQGLRDELVHNCIGNVALRDYLANACRVGAEVL